MDQTHRTKEAGQQVPSCALQPALSSTWSNVFFVFVTSYPRAWHLIAIGVSRERMKNKSGNSAHCVAICEVPDTAIYSTKKTYTQHQRKHANKLSLKPSATIPFFSLKENFTTLSH